MPRQLYDLAGLVAISEGEKLLQELPPGWEKIVLTKEWYKPRPEPPMQFLHEVKIITQEGYAVRRIMAPSVSHVVAMLAEEDKDELANTDVTAIEVKRVQF